MSHLPLPPLRRPALALLAVGLLAAGCGTNEPPHPRTKARRPIAANEVQRDVERLIRRHASDAFFTVQEMTEWDNFENFRMDLCQSDPTRRPRGDGRLRCDAVDIDIDEDAFFEELAEILERLFDPSLIVDETATEVVYESDGQLWCGASTRSTSARRECRRMMRTVPIRVTASGPQAEAGAIDLVFEIDVRGDWHEIGYVELSRDRVHVFANLEPAASLLTALENEYRDDIEDETDLDLRPHRPDRSEGTLSAELTRHAEDSYEFRYRVFRDVRIDAESGDGIELRGESSSAPQLQLRLNSLTGEMDAQVDLKAWRAAVAGSILERAYPRFSGDEERFVAQFPGLRLKLPVAADDHQWRVQALGLGDRAELRYGDARVLWATLQPDISALLDTAHPGVGIGLDRGFEIEGGSALERLDRKLETDLPLWALDDAFRLNVTPGGQWDFVAYPAAGRLVQAVAGSATLEAQNGPRGGYDLRNGRCLDEAEARARWDEEHPMNGAFVQACSDEPPAAARSRVCHEAAVLACECAEDEAQKTACTELLDAAKAATAEAGTEAECTGEAERVAQCALAHADGYCEVQTTGGAVGEDNDYVRCVRAPADEPELDSGE